MQDVERMPAAKRWKFVTSVSRQLDRRAGNTRKSMQLNITARHFPLTDAIKEYTETRVASLEHLFSSGGSHVHVILDHDGHHSGEEYRVAGHIGGANLKLDAQTSASDLYQGIDLMVEKLSHQLRKATERVQEHR